MELTIIGIALWALIPGFMAQKKGRSFWAYFFLSFLISPLITFIIVACLSNKSKDPELFSTPPTPKLDNHDNPEYCENCGADTSNDVDSCHVCGQNKKIAIDGETN